MDGYSIYLMIQLAQATGVMSKELEYDLAWTQGRALYWEFMGTNFDKQNKSQYDCITDFLSTKEKTAVKNCWNCHKEYIPTPDNSFCSHCLEHL